MKLKAQRLSDTTENRRLRAMLRFIQEREGVLAGLAEVSLADDGFHIVVCCEGDEQALGNAVAQRVQDMNCLALFYLQALRDVSTQAQIVAIEERVEQLLAATRKDPT